jgi:hypothetical protein
MFPMELFEIGGPQAKESRSSQTPIHAD